MIASKIVLSPGIWGMMALLSSLSLIACDAPTESQASTPDVTIAFEKEYVKNTNPASRESIQLIGFKKITIPSADIEAFDAAYTLKFTETHKNYLWDKSIGVLTVYFPVESALVEFGDDILEANPLGELAPVEPFDEPVSIHVIGRRQTDTVSGVEGNIIKNGVIYLAEKNAPIRQFDRVYVFDFGIKVLPAHHDHDLSNPEVNTAGGVSCMQNHGGKNCSNAFGIYQGRCTFNKNVCMDYNGWFTNCQNGSVVNFPGSDCDYALGAGHCWNEIM